MAFTDAFSRAYVIGLLQGSLTGCLFTFRKCRREVRRMSATEHQLRWDAEIFSRYGRVWNPKTGHYEAPK